MATPSAVVALNDILKVRVVCQAGDQISVNVLGYKVTGLVAPGPTCSELAVALDTAFETPYKDLLSQFASYYGVGVSRVSPTVSLESAATGNTAIGNLVENLMPRQVAGIFTKHSAGAGPGGRGRVYVPFPGRDQDDAVGKPVAGYMVLLGVLAATLQLVRVVASGGGGNATISPCILKRANYPASPLWITSSARIKWATQKRRGVYGRPNTLPF